VILVPVADGLSETRSAHFAAINESPSGDKVVTSPSGSPVCIGAKAREGS
jgi:hypothetical protein